MLDMICSSRNSVRISDSDGLPVAKRQKLDNNGDSEESGLKRQVSQTVKTNPPADIAN